MLKTNVLYPQKNKIFHILFDMFFLLYLVAYFVFYHDGYGSIRGIATGGIIVFGVIISWGTGSKINGYFLWYLGFIVLGVVSILWAKSDSQILSILITLTRILIISLFLSVRITRNQDIELILFFYIVTIVILDLYVGKKMIDLYSFEGLFRVRFGDNFAFNSNSVALSNVIAVLVLIHKFKIDKKHIIYQIAFALFLIVILITESKKGILCLLFGITLVFYYRGNGANKRLERLFVAIMLLIVAWQVLTNVPFLYEIIGYRLDSMINALNMSNQTDVSTKNRMLLIQYALELWSDHPLLGVGLNNFSIYQTIGDSGYYAHNNYLELLADLGMIGFIYYYYMPFKLVRVRIDMKDDLQIILKAIVWCILFADFASVTYQEFKIHIFYILFYILIFNMNPAMQKETIYE